MRKCVEFSGFCKRDDLKDGPFFFHLAVSCIFITELHRTCWCKWNGNTFTYGSLALWWKGVNHMWARSEHTKKTLVAHLTWAQCWCSLQQRREKNIRLKQRCCDNAGFSHFSELLKALSIYVHLSGYSCLIKDCIRRLILSLLFIVSQRAKWFMGRRTPKFSSSCWFSQCNKLNFPEVDSRGLKCPCW